MCYSTHAFSLFLVYFCGMTVPLTDLACAAFSVILCRCKYFFETIPCLLFKINSSSVSMWHELVSSACFCFLISPSICGQLCWWVEQFSACRQRKIQNVVRIHHWSYLTSFPGTPRVCNCYLAENQELAHGDGLWQKILTWISLYYWVQVVAGLNHRWCLLPVSNDFCERDLCR